LWWRAAPTYSQLKATSIFGEPHRFVTLREWHRESFGNACPCNESITNFAMLSASGRGGNGIREDFGRERVARISTENHSTGTTGLPRATQMSRISLVAARVFAGVYARPCFVNLTLSCPRGSTGRVMEKEEPPPS